MATRTRRKTRTTSAKKSRRTGSKRKKGGFQYKSRSESDYNKKASESAGNYDSYLQDGVQMYKPHDGKNHIRICPPSWPDADDFALTLNVHYSIGADQQTYLCPKTFDGNAECAICNEHERLNKEGETDDASHFKSKKRKGFYLIDRRGDDKEEVFWSCPFGTWQDIIMVCKDDEDGSIIEVDHPYEGHDVLFNKEGQALKTKYQGVRLGKPKPIFKEDDDTEELLERIQERPVPDILKVYDNEYLEGVLEGTIFESDDDDDDEDDDDEPRRKKRGKKRATKKSSRSRRRSRDEEDEEDEEEDEEDEGDEEEEDEEDEEEDEDEEDEEDEEEDEEDEEDEEEDEEEDDEEEEEETPRRRKRSGKSSGASSRLKRAASRAKKRGSKKTSSRRKRR